MSSSEAQAFPGRNGRFVVSWAVLPAVALLAIIAGATAYVAVGSAPARVVWGVTLLITGDLLGGRRVQDDRKG
jgi:hypothetical protein